MQTPATTALDAAGVPYGVIEYELADSGGYGDQLVASLGLDPDSVGKTLVVALDDGRHVIAIVPVSGSLDLKALARAAGVKRASLASTDVAERLTGSVVGGIAPLGHRRTFEVYVDELLTISPEIHVSGGRRGLEVTLRPQDLLAATAATVAALAT